LITGSKRQVVPENNLGGIISDEMGMGKSLTMLSAIVGSRADAESFARSKGRDLVPKGVQKPASKATLIVVPSVCKWLLIAFKFVCYGTPQLILARDVVLLEGWIEEVQTYDNNSRIISTVTNSSLRHILPNTLNIHKYHGPKKELSPLKLLDYDVIFTTYATVAAEFRRGNNVLNTVNWFRILLDEGKFAKSLLSSPNILASYSNSDRKRCSPYNPSPKHYTIPRHFNKIVQDSLVSKWNSDPEFAERPRSTYQISPSPPARNNSSISEPHYIAN
jgi:hypothetical protein